MTDSVAVPKGLLEDLYAGLAKVEEVLATLEELMDSEGLDRIRKAEEEYTKGQYVIAESSSEIRKFLK